MVHGTGSFEKVKTRRRSYLTAKPLNLKSGNYLLAALEVNATGCNKRRTKLPFSFPKLRICIARIQGEGVFRYRWARTMEAWERLLVVHDTGKL